MTLEVGLGGWQMHFDHRRTKKRQHNDEVGGTDRKNQLCQVEYPSASNTSQSNSTN